MPDPSLNAKPRDQQSGVHSSPESIVFQSFSIGSITHHSEVGDVNRFVIPAAIVRDSLSRGLLSVYSWNKDHIEDITATYQPPGGPVEHVTATPVRVVIDRVDVADPSSSDRLGETCYPTDHGSRWMVGHASLRMKALVSPDKAAHHGL